MGGEGGERTRCKKKGRCACGTGRAKVNGGGDRGGDWFSH